MFSPPHTSFDDVSLAVKSICLIMLTVTQAVIKYFIHGSGRLKCVSVAIQLQS